MYEEIKENNKTYATNTNTHHSIDNTTTWSDTKRIIVREEKISDPEAIMVYKF